jgi:rhamnogalacturonan endolyase
MSRFLVLVLLLFGPALARAQQPAVLANETFEDFPVGWFSVAATPLYEYHYLKPPGYRGRWEDAVIMNGRDRYWLIDQENGNKFMEQTLANESKKGASPIVITGDPEWADYTVEVKVRPLASRDSAGVVFRYRTNRNLYLLALEDGKRIRLSLRDNESAFHKWNITVLGQADFPYTADEYVTLRVENQGEQIRCFANGKPVIQARDKSILKGKVGLLANAPARFDDVRVTTTPENARAIAARVKARQDEEARLRAENPRPKLWKKLDTPKFGAGRAVRFGDLDGDGRPDVVMAQNMPRIKGDAYDLISCLTAMTLDGKVLWQIGEPSRDNALLTNDLPVQIHDIDGDGRNEVIFVKDFKIQVVEGATGKLKYWAWAPPPSEAENAFDRTHGDSLAFVNVSGNKTARDLLLKDRYNKFWIFDSKLKLLWATECRTGHYPFPYDANGDGKDEIFIGYSMYSADGKQLWSHDAELKDHADGIAAGRWGGDPAAPPKVIISGSDEGFMLLDLNGQMLKHIRLGHAQSPTVAKVRPDVPGLQFINVNFWNNPGIITILDSEANILTQLEPIHMGSPILPVNWRGDGVEYIFLNGDVKDGGLLDGWGRRVVMFPDDSHPTLCGQALNLTGDERDEIVLWDQDRMWIYTQDRPFTGKRIYAPRRNPDYNESNYRSNVSLPDWKELK